MSRGSSGNSNAPFRPTWRSLNDNGGHAPNTNNDPDRIEVTFRHSTADASRGSRDPRQITEERIVRRPSSFSGSPDHQHAHSPVHIVLFNNMPERGVNPRLTGSLPSFRIHQHVHIPATPMQQEDSRSNQDEQKNVLSKLKKEIYNPIPKQMTKRLSSFYKDQKRSSNHNDKIKEIELEGKRCAVCLEDFEPREQVMLTPCDHMFHEECILPWVKSHGQCPVCRFVLSDSIRRQTSSTTSNNNVSNVPAADLFAVGELISIIGAMQEAFLWGNSR